ncbi:MAG: DUF4330 domain-containing protein [Candidatus Omnitrophica bacterium]|nr:DUF4330 domain-containing protein [Candidatus Omnitrophota bacterium]
MKLLDEKGRLFGKINVIDFFIITLLVIIIPAFFQVYKIMGKSPTRISHEWIKVKAITFTLPHIADLIAPGQLASDGFEGVRGKILKVTKADNEYGNKMKSMMGKNVLSEYEYRIPVFLELELSCTQSAKGESWYYNRIPIVVGMEKILYFTTDKYEIQCYTLEVEE